MSEPIESDADALPKRRFLDRRSASPTLVAAGSRFEGDLHCAGDLSVAGSVIGNGEVQGMLTLSDRSSWSGAVNCRDALVAGHFEGELVVLHKLEVRASAHLRGRIRAAHIAVAEGAVIEAEIASGEVVEHFSERRQD